MQRMKELIKVVIKHFRALSSTVKLQAVEQESIRFNKKEQNERTSCLMKR